MSTYPSFATLHAEIINDKQQGAAKLGYVLIPPLKLGSQVIQNQRKICHADGNLFLHQRICDTSGKVAFPGANAPPQQIADILCEHCVPMLNIETGVFHLWAFAVVIGKCPVTHSRISEAPALQICHGLKVMAGLLLRCLPVDALLLTPAGAREGPSLQ